MTATIATTTCPSQQATAFRDRWPELYATLVPIIERDVQHWRTDFYGEDGSSTPSDCAVMAKYGPGRYLIATRTTGTDIQPLDWSETFGPVKLFTDSQQAPRGSTWYEVSMRSNTAHYLVTVRADGSGRLRPVTQERAQRLIDAARRVAAQRT